MATLREIRRRIVGVKSTAKITQAMKMVAAAKLRRAQEAIGSARPYAKALDALLKELLTNAGESVSDSPILFGSGPVDPSLERVLFIVVTSDRGLAGAFNSGLIRFTEAHILENYPVQHEAGNLSLITIGRRGTDYYSKRSREIIYRHPGIFSKLDFESAKLIAEESVSLYEEGKFHRVILIFNEFKSVISQNQVVEQVLPIVDRQIAAEGAAPSAVVNIDYIFEPAPKEILDDLVPKYLEMKIWRALLESSAAEQGARMTAMDAATRNAKDLVNELQLQFNKARQAAITKEILEIVGGAEALADN